MSEWDRLWKQIPMGYTLSSHWLSHVKDVGDKLQERIEIMEDAKKTIHDNLIEPQRQKLQHIEDLLRNAPVAPEAVPDLIMKILVQEEVSE